MWITNISRPDTWVESFPETAEKFTGTLTKKYREYKDEFDSELYGEIYKGISEQGVGYKVGDKHWNGLMILPGAVHSSELSFHVYFKQNEQKEKRGGTAARPQRGGGSEQQQGDDVRHARHHGCFRLCLYGYVCAVYGLLEPAVHSVYAGDESHN